MYQINLVIKLFLQKCSALRLYCCASFKRRRKKEEERRRKKKKEKEKEEEQRLQSARPKKT